MRVSNTDTRIVPLTDTKIRSTKPADEPVKLMDDRGLYLEIRSSG